MKNLTLTIIITLAAFAGVFGQNTQTTQNKADQSIKSSVRVNPVTRAMEFSLPLGGYSGRAGNSIPISLSYSSKVWTSEMINSRFVSNFVPSNQDYHHLVYQSTDVNFSFAQRSQAGWTSSLQPVAIIEESEQFNEQGEIYRNDISQFLQEYCGSLEFNGEGLVCSVADTWTSSIGTGHCSSGVANFYQLTCFNRNGEMIEGVFAYSCLGGVGGGGIFTGNGQFPTPTPPPSPTPTPPWMPTPTPNTSPTPLPPGPTPTPQTPFVVHRLRIAMPDGSTREFRQSDITYNCATNPADCYNPGSSQYLSVDGSRMRLERREVQANNEVRDVLYLPDGGRYLFPVNGAPSGHPYQTAEMFIDANGNVTKYDSTTRTWTDTLGRTTTNPLKDRLNSEFPSQGTQSFNLKGVNGAERQYGLVWGKVSENLDPSSGASLKYVGQDTCFSEITNETPISPSLFQNQPTSALDDQIVNNVRYIKRQRACSYMYDGQPIVFDPIVLAGVNLPNGQVYQFKYNEYGEITKIIYPTGAYERFEYETIPPLGYNALEIYSQTNRGVRKRWVSSDGGSTSEVETSYGGLATANNTTTGGFTNNPDGTRSERIMFSSTNSQFGFQDPIEGMVKEERTFDADGKIRSRTINDWESLGPQGSAGYLGARRDPRLLRSLKIGFEGTNAKALAVLTKSIYDDVGSTNLSDFPHLNVKRSESYHYIALNASEVDYEDLSWNDIPNWFPASKLASVSETDYSYDANYKARGIIGLPVESRVLDPTNKSNVLGKTQTVYDNALPNSVSGYGYSMQSYGTGNSYNCTGTVTCWLNPNGASGNVDMSYRGLPTTSRVWVKETNTWIESHVKYDQFGNSVAAKDPIDNETTTVFSSDYKYAYPTSVTTPAPDPTNTTGTNQPSTVETTYDFNTGLTLTVKNDFGQITATEYNDPLLRPTRSYAVNFTAPETQTIYGDTPGNLFVKVRKQIDSTNWDEATTFADSLGRTIKTQATDSQGDIFVETHYDLLGRVERVTNPYRLGDTKYWSKTRYDVAGRAVETFAPATDGEIATAEQYGNNNNLTSIGLTSFEISTVDNASGNFVGTVVTTKDASGRRGRSITNALGHLIRVDEPTGINGTTAEADLGELATPFQATSYKYDVFGKMVEVTQGVQKRWFKYDALGRLLRVSQPEQERNPNLDLSDSFNTSGHWTAGFAYDLMGNVVRATDANGVNVINDFDRAGRVIRRCYTKPNINTSATTCTPIIGTTSESTDTPAVSFLYDGIHLNNEPFAKGKLTKVSSTVSATEYQLFDNFGRVTQAAQITDGNTYTSRYTYSFSGALVEEEYPSGRKVTNEFEPDGDLAKVTSKKNSTSVNAPFVSNFSYTASGGVSQMKLGNGRWETAKFNNRMQVTELGLGASASDTGNWKTHYEYGELQSNGTVDTTKNTGNIARQTLSFNGITHPLVQSYKYDALYRITEATETTNSVANWFQVWGYDRYGNRTSFTQNIGGNPASVNPTIVTATNRFDETGTNFDYDLNGNLIRDGEGRQFTFNGDNKQTVVKDANNNTIGQYFYDGEGKRVKKISNSETTIFVYSSGKLVAEYSSQLSTTASVSYTTTDHLGTPRIITDAVGQVKSRRDFLPFGEDLVAGIGSRTTANRYGSTSEDIRQKFTGYQKDTETSLDFAEARMYDNRFGRFTAVDPLLASGKSANPQTFNRYIYCLNNPIGCVDPTGLDGIWGFRHLGDGRWQFQFFENQAAFDDMNNSMVESGCTQGACSLYKLWTGGEFAIHGDRTAFRLFGDGRHQEFSLAYPWTNQSEWAALTKSALNGGFSADQVRLLEYASEVQKDLAESDAVLDEVLIEIDTFLNGDPGKPLLKMGNETRLLKLLVNYRKTLRGAAIANNETGAYVHEFESGFKYVGKGTRARMEQTGKDISRNNNDKLLNSTFIAAPSNTHKEAFVMEHLLMMRHTRGLGPLSVNPNSPTYNQIFSPGRRYWEFLDDHR